MQLDAKLFVFFHDFEQFFSDCFAVHGAQIVERRRVGESADVCSTCAMLLARHCDAGIVNGVRLDDRNDACILFRAAA